MRTVLKGIVKEYYKRNHKKRKFQQGFDSVKVSGRVFGCEEIMAAIDASLEFWLTEGKRAEEFSRNLAKFLGIKFVSLVNSGSSANLAAFSALTSPKLGERRIKKGDEVITVACSFPTTVNPIIQYGAIPVFIDVDISTRNAIVHEIKKAISKKTKAIFIAHTLGNPFNIKVIADLAKTHGIWLIEDCCDALGSKYQDKYVSTFGDLATFSFYPAHQITTGEGGAVVTNNPNLYVLINSFCEWGRDCWCRTGQDNRCGRRFKFKLGDLPYGYDHKYTYSHIGYNLKMTDIQAAIGLEQLKRLPSFIKKRRSNFDYLYNALSKHEKYFILPKWERESEPCWFGFMLVIRDNAPFSRLDAVNFLQENKIETRSLFAGNLLRHPAYLDVEKKVVSTLKNSDKIMNDGFWIGVYPGIDQDMLRYVVFKFDEFIKNFAN